MISENECGKPNVLISLKSDIWSPTLGNQLEVLVVHTGTSSKGRYVIAIAVIEG